MGIEQLGVYAGMVLFILLVIVTWLAARIASRAGYPGWWALSQLIPVVNVVLMWLFAFAKWPVEEKAAGKRGA